MEKWHASLNVAFYGFLIANAAWYASACFGIRIENGVKETMRNAWRKAWAGSGKTRYQDEFQRNLNAVVERRRLEWARSALKTLCGFACILGGVLFGLDVTGFPITAACFLAGGFAIFAGQVLQHMLTGTVVRLLYSWLMLVHVLSCVPYMMGSEAVLETTGHVLRFASRLCCGFLVMDVRLSVIWNVLYTMAFCILSAQGPRGLDESGRWTFELKDAVVREAFVLLVVLVILRERVLLLKSEALSIAESLAFQNEGSAKTSLLKAMCDVVVVLDEDLRIAEACPQLRHMLRTSHNLMGDRLHDHMPAEEDRERLGIGGRSAPVGCIGSQSRGWPGSGPKSSDGRVSSRISFRKEGSGLGRGLGATGADFARKIALRLKAASVQCRRLRHQLLSKLEP